MRRKLLIILLSMAVVALAVCALALTVVDISNEAITRGNLARLVCVSDEGSRTKATAARPLTTGDDLDRASTMYQQMCAFCHGARKVRMVPFARALSPRPPQFVIEPSGRLTWMDAYVIQDGIRWTGMPSFRACRNRKSGTWHCTWKGGINRRSETSIDQRSRNET
jgi:mono/diheme cytochrome c family protein